MVDVVQSVTRYLAAIRPKLLCWSSIAVFVVGAATFATADAVVFDINGSFRSGGSISGTVTLDTSSGIISGFDFSVDGTAFSSEAGATYYSEPYSICCYADGTNIPEPHVLTYFTSGGSPSGTFSVLLPPATLIGYSGSAICSIDALNCLSFLPPDGQSVAPSGSLFYLNVPPLTSDYLTSGTLSPNSSVPEPESSSLLVAGTLLTYGLRILCSGLTSRKI